MTERSQEPAMTIKEVTREQIELKPCPFCGSSDITVSPDDVGSGGQWIFPIVFTCQGCQAEVVADGDSVEDAATAWNARALDPVLAENARLRALLVETQDTIRDAANGGNASFGDLWRKIDDALRTIPSEPLE